MKKYILYTFLVFFAFSTASFGKKEDEEDRSSKVPLKREDKDIPWGLLIEAGRPDGLSPQAHINPDKKYDPPNSSYTRGTTFYISRDALGIILENSP